MRQELIDGEIIAMAGGAPSTVVRDPSSPTHVINPKAVFEVLSQDAPKIEPWSKASASGAWSYAAYGPGDVVDLRSIGRRLDVNELYAVAGVTKP